MARGSSPKSVTTRVRHLGGGLGLLSLGLVDLVVLLRKAEVAKELGLNTVEDGGEAGSEGGGGSEESSVESDFGHFGS